MGRGGKAKETVLEYRFVAVNTLRCSRFAWSGVNADDRIRYFLGGRDNSKEAKISSTFFFRPTTISIRIHEKLI